MSFTIQSKGFEHSEDVINYIKDNIDSHTQEMLLVLGETIVAEARSNLQNNTNRY